ncbi:MAG: vWA domain-containing protein [Bacteroidia bacterium]
MKTTLELSLSATSAFMLSSLICCSCSINSDSGRTGGLEFGGAALEQARPDSLLSARNQQERTVQIVFALDATGSMSSLIGTAKEKIWSIASSFTQSDAKTQVEVGLIFYRDRGDAFITKKIDLSNDLDNVYEQLMSIKADGGGDSPESVNQGLYEAVTKMSWAKDTATYKTIFLVGDCPPHMDYGNDIKYPRSCQLAKQKDIILNAILMGNDPTAKVIWKEIANCSQGEFMQVDMNANNLTVLTPYDQQIAKLSAEMDQTRIYYGSEEYKQKNETKQVQSTKIIESTSASTVARRAEYNITTSSGNTAYYGTNELVNDYKAGKIQIAKVKADQLPPEIARLDAQKKKEYLDKMVAKRDSIDKNMKILVDKRRAYVEQELAKKEKSEVEGSFDNQVYENVKKQAARKDVKLKGRAKY